MLSLLLFIPYTLYETYSNPNAQLGIGMGNNMRYKFISGNIAMHANMIPVTAPDAPTAV
jgi:hypothetical protein